MHINTLFFKSLQSRIVVLFLTLILVVQFAGFGAIWYSINKNARASVDEQLLVGEDVLQNVMQGRGENLALGASILAADFGFRQAIATADSETIISALDNLSARIDANITMLYSSEGVRKFVSGTPPEAQADLAVENLITSVQRGGNPFALTVFKGVPYQIVVVPVKAPLTIAWIVAGFEINDEWAARIKTLSHLEVSFLTKNNLNQWVLSSSTLPTHEEQSTAKSIVNGVPMNWMNATHNTQLMIDKEEYGTRYVQILNSENEVVLAVLQRSVNDALTPYLALQLNLLGLTVLGALVFIAGSIVTARRVTKPLSELVKTAELLEKGDYSVAIESQSQDEVGNLARTFDRMRGAIAEREQNISKLAYWDDLTQLPNRAYFTQQLMKLSDEYKTTYQSFSVLIMDLDRFKHVNDVLGHRVADNLLIGVANRLKANKHDALDVVARLGDDEFGLILVDSDAEKALNIARQLQVALEVPIAVNEYFVDLSAGMGIANFPEHTENVELLVSRAEIAMYTAKQSHSGVMVYESSLDVANDESLSLISEIKQAVEQNQLSLYIQPKVDFENGKVLSVEALVRWKHPERGLIFPDTFIPFAEQTGHISKITMWMLNEAASYTALWKKEGIDISIAVNLSAKDLIDIELPNKLKTILNKHQISASALTLEITESSIMEDPARALDTIERIALMGVKFSIDDFGTGYSSLAYLKRLPVNELKIDKSFVMNIEHDYNDEMIVRSTIDLGHNLGLKVVAEGIENKQVWNMLKAMGCDYGQGYLMARPMPADNLIVWMRSWTESIGE